MGLFGKSKKERETEYMSRLDVPSCLKEDFELIIDDIFTIMGVGTVATGNILTGMCREGENACIYKANGDILETRITTVDVHTKERKANGCGYTDFIFLNRFGQPQHQSTLNKAIRRIIRDCNDEQFLKTENPEVLLPHFSCHSLRHTFTTRMCEAGVNIKVIQDTLGHKDITTTLNIYTDVTKELKRTEFDGLDKYFNNSIA